MLKLTKKIATALLVAIIFFISTQAFADENLQQASDVLDNVITKWKRTLLKAGDHPDSRTYSAKSSVALASQQKVNNEANTKLTPFLSQLSKEKVLQFVLISDLTGKILKAENWQQGVNATINDNTDNQELLSALDSVLDISPQANKKEQPSTNQSALINEAINVLIDELNTLDTVLGVNRWEVRTTSFRSSFDEKVIDQLMAKYSYTEVLDTFTFRLSTANSLPEDQPYKQLHPLLTLLHVYLVPKTGLRTIHLGLRTESQKILARDDRNENNRNGVIDAVHAEIADSHQENIAQAVHHQPLIDALTKIAQTRKHSVVTFDELKNGTALMLTAVLFDLWEVHSLKDNKELLLPAFTLLKTVGQLWDYKTCWKMNPKKAQGFDSIEHSCAELSIYSTESSLRIKEGFNTLNKGYGYDQTGYQWGYAGTVIRKVNNIEVPEWMK